MNKQIIDAMAMKRALTRITYEIIEKNKGTNQLVLIGIKTRGEFIAQRIAEQMKKLEGATVPVIALDITGYRDDQPSQAAQSQGRPQTVQIAVLIDRGHREMPIRPDFVGKNVPTANSEAVRVNMTEIDDQDKVELIK